MKTKVDRWFDTFNAALNGVALYKCSNESKRRIFVGGQ